MTKKDIQQIMAIVRPAVVALYGRQPLRLAKYERSLTYASTGGWLHLSIAGREDNYKVIIESDRIIKLEKVDDD